MEKEILKQIGLTDGEIRVYSALIDLGKSSTGAIMQKSGISSSKVYLILEKLIQKGLISFVIEENIKKFQIANPNTIIDYIKKKKDNLQVLEDKSRDLIKTINSIIGKYEEESVQIYKGFKGAETAFTKLIDETDKGGVHLFFSHDKEELEDLVLMFFKKIKDKRERKNIKALGIVHPILKKAFQTKVPEKFYKVKFSKIAPPTPITMGKNSILMTLWGKNPLCIEIKSKRMIKKYTEYFYSVWNS